MMSLILLIINEFILNTIGNIDANEYGTDCQMAG